eukprot:754040-Hanusia_phi.AAC.2
MKQVFFSISASHAVLKANIYVFVSPLHTAWTSLPSYNATFITSACALHARVSGAWELTPMEHHSDQPGGGVIMNGGIQARNG